MDMNAQIMNTVPFASIAPLVVALVALGIVAIAVKVVQVEMANRREAHLQAMDSNPELIALGMPVPELDNARAANRVDTGAILREEGFAV